MKSDKIWSRPYFGVTHYGQVGNKRWSSIIQYTDSFVLLKHEKGESCLEETFEDINLAKQAGEAWANG